MYTGDPSDKITAYRFKVSQDTVNWPEKLSNYISTLTHPHAKWRTISQGQLLVTELSDFPSTLMLLQIPHGDINLEHIISMFLVTENLKRLGCTGRVGFSLHEPNATTSTKFYQLYCINDKINIKTAVKELVKLCQAALSMFGLLQPEYADGLLCDLTGIALKKWWHIFGREIYKLEPRGDRLDSMAVAGLIGLFIGCKNRLHHIGAPVTKDAFDLHSTRQGISVFQKLQRLPHSKHFDLDTVRRLRMQTEKAASSEGWHMPRAVKTTVAEISGKGEELMSVAGKRTHRHGFAEVETTDINDFVQALSGKRCESLWHGKSPKPSSSIQLRNDKTKEDQIKYSKKETMPETAASRLDIRHSLDLDPSEAFRSNLDVSTSRLKAVAHRDMAAKVVNEMLDDGKAGINRLREAVNLHRRRPPIDPDTLVSVLDNLDTTLEKGRFLRPLDKPPSVSIAAKKERHDPRQNNNADQYLSQNNSDVLHLKHELTESPKDYSPDDNKAGTTIHLNDSYEADVQPLFADNPQTPFDETSGQYNGAGDWADSTIAMIRTQSDDEVVRRSTATHPSEQSRPRQLSFSTAIDSIHHQPQDYSPVDRMTTDTEYFDVHLKVEELDALRLALNKLSDSEALDTMRQNDILNELVKDLQADEDGLEHDLPLPEHDLQVLRTDGRAVLKDIHELLKDGRREIDSFTAKLDYDMIGLKNKADELEDGVRSFEKTIDDAERRMNRVEEELEGRNRFSWTCIMS